MEILDGKKLSLKIIENLKEKVNKLEYKPTLAVILVGDDPASKVYVKNKEKRALETGFNSVLKILPENTTKDELLKIIENLNNDKEINGILLQLPLPKHLDPKDFLDKINPIKDVDGFNTYNAGKLFKGEIPYAAPCTPLGIIKLLSEYNIDLEGKIATVIGRSNIVGKPVANMLLSKNATVIQTHSKTKNLEDLTKMSDIIISATGKAHFIKEDMVKEGVVIIDVGIVKGEDGKLKGDVDFDNVKNKASFITPVPGGIGPMTIAMLMENTYKLYLIQKGIL